MRKQTASSFSSIELLLSLHYSPVFEMTFDLGRCSTYVNSSGEVVEKYAMEEEKNWLQNVAMLKVIQKNHMPFNLGEKRDVKEWLQEHDEKARPMCAETLLAVQTVQTRVGGEKRIAHLAELKAELGQRFLNTYLDLWKNTKTNDHYGAVNYSWLERSQTNVSLDPKVEQTRPIWTLETGLLDFEEFPDQSHTAENLLTFYEGSLKKNGLDTTHVNMCVPDGASVCRKMMNLVLDKDPGHDSTICNAHDSARASLDGLGHGGKKYENDELKKLTEKNNHICEKLRNMSKAAKHLHDAQKQFGLQQPKQSTRKAVTRWNGKYMDCVDLNMWNNLVNESLDELGPQTKVSKDSSTSDSSSENDQPEVITVQSTDLQLTPTETKMNRELQGTLRSAFDATQLIQGENGGCSTDESWDIVFGLHAFYSSGEALVQVPRPVVWPLEETVTLDLVKASDLRPSIQKQRKIMAASLEQRFITRGPSDTQLTAMKLNPVRQHTTLTDTQKLRMNAIYARRLKAMERQFGRSEEGITLSAPQPPLQSRQTMGTFADFIPQPTAPKPSEATVRAFESEEEIYQKLIANQERVWYYGGVDELVKQPDGTMQRTSKFKPLIFWAHEEIMHLLPCHVRLVRIDYSLLLAEAVTERTFSDSGLTSSLKRKRLAPTHLSNATMCNDTERHFPAGALELRAEYYK